MTPPTLAAAQAPPARRAPGPLPAPTRLQADQVAPAGDVLARAFHDDPLFVYAEPDGARRLRGLAGPFRSLLRYGRRQGHVQTTAGTEGAAIWVKPGSYPLTAWQMVRSGFPLWTLQMGPRMLGRVEEVMNQWEAPHARHAPGLHWYLWVLGVDPPHQGRGLGGHLMKPVLDRADAQGLACWLETTQPRNVAFYRRHGFEVMEEGRDPVRWWGMRRDPRPAQPSRGAPGGARS